MDYVKLTVLLFVSFVIINGVKNSDILFMNIFQVTLKSPIFLAPASYILYTRYLLKLRNEENVTTYNFEIEGLQSYSPDPYPRKHLDDLQRILHIQAVSIVQVKILASSENDAAQLLVMHDAVSDSFKIEKERTTITVAVADIGVEMEHTDLKPVINRQLSYNFVNDNADPTPDNGEMLTFKDDERYGHGTRCAGLISGIPHGRCKASAVSNVKLVVLKIFKLDGLKYTIEAEASSMLYMLNAIDIFSASYLIGNGGNGKFNELAPLTNFALKNGVQTGRQCRGRLFLYPSGLGGNGNCNTQGHAKSIYTITIAYINKGRRQSYLTNCPCVLASTFGDGFVTTDSHNSCTRDFNSSSASVAIAASKISLVLQANPLLSKRDIEHIIVNTATATGLETRAVWNENGFGFRFSDKFGFGVMDVDEMVNLASKWKFLPEEHTCIVHTNPKDPFRCTFVREDIYIEYPIFVNGCQGKPNHVAFMEHLEINLNFTLKASSQLINLQNIKTYIVSPVGTESLLLNEMDIYERHAGVKNYKWNFSSVNFWGENPYGQWKVMMHLDEVNETVEYCMYSITLTLYGTAIHPYTAGQPKTCKASTNPTKGPYKSISEEDNVDHTFREQAALLVAFAFGCLFFCGIATLFRLPRVGGGLYFKLKFKSTNEIPYESNRKTNDTNLNVEMSSLQTNHARNETNTVSNPKPYLYDVASSTAGGHTDGMASDMNYGTNKAKCLSKDSTTRTCLPKESDGLDSFGKPFQQEIIITQSDPNIRLANSEVEATIGQEDLTNGLKCFASTFSDVRNICIKLDLKQHVRLVSPAIEFILQGVTKLCSYAIIKMPYIGKLEDLVVLRMLSDGGSNKLAAVTEVPRRSSVDGDLDTFFIPDTRNTNICIYIYTKVMSWYTCVAHCGKRCSFDMYGKTKCNISNVAMDEYRANISLMVYSELHCFRDYRQDGSARGERIKLPLEITGYDPYLITSLQNVDKLTDCWENLDSTRPADGKKKIYFRDVINCCRNREEPQVYKWWFSNRAGSNPTRFEYILHMDYEEEPNSFYILEYVHVPNPKAIEHIEQCLIRYREDEQRRIMTEIIGSLRISHDGSITNILRECQSQFSKEAFAERILNVFEKFSLFDDIKTLTEVGVIPQNTTSTGLRELSGGPECSYDQRTPEETKEREQQLIGIKENAIFPPNFLA